MKLFKDYRIYEWISHLLLVAFMFLFLFFSSNRCLPRLFFAIKTLFKNLLYFFMKLFEFNPNFEAGLDLEKTYEFSGGIEAILPFSIDTLKYEFFTYFQMLVNLDTYIIFFKTILPTIKLIFQIFLLLILIFIFFYIFKEQFFSPNDFNINEDRAFVIKWKKIKIKYIYPTFNWIKDFINFNMHIVKRYWYLLLILFLLHINVFSICCDVISWYFYFFIDFNFKTLFDLICSILIDLSPFLLRLPFIFYLIIFYIIFDRWRLNVGLDRLNHFENYNKGFINSLGAYTFITGSPGAGKTALMTDMTLSSEELRRNKLLSIIKEIQLMYPHFPFIKFEKKIDEAIDKGFIKNHYQASAFIENEINKFINTNDSSFLFDYDFQCNNQDYNNGLYIETLFESLLDYASAYSLFSLNTPLVASNYSIRFNGEIVDNGFYKRWQYDYFTYDPYNIDYYFNSKILDFNYMRIQQKMDSYVSSNSYLNHPEDINGFVLDCVGISIMEITTERKNQLFTNRIKKDDTSTHQLNDGFNNYARVKRHDSTIRNQMIFQCFMDGQRVGDLNSALAEINEYNICIHKDNSEWKYCLPLYFHEPVFAEWILDLCDSFISKYRLNRGDNSFLIYVVESISYYVNLYYLKRKNTYMYKKLKLDVNSSVDKFDQDYFLMKKKIYSRRYATDGYSLFFKDKYLENTNFGFVDIPNYESYITSSEEFRSQNSYIVKDLSNYTSSNDNSFYETEDD